MKTFTIALLCFCPLFLLAQYTQPTRIFEKGQIDLQSAVGIFPTYLADQPESVMPPVHIGLRWMVADPFSVSIFAAYSTSRSREVLSFDSARGRWKNQTLFIGIENGFHYTRIDNWDFYGGFSLLYQHIHVDTDSPKLKRMMPLYGIKARRGKMALTAYIGSRFALSSHYSVFIDLGYGVSLLRVGVGYRL